MLGRYIANPAEARDLRAEACDATGRLRVMPAEFYAGTTTLERALLAQRTGSYLLPTHELVSWIKAQIGDRRAIEIGSGNGVLAEALGIRATDSRLQERPDIAAHYAMLGQPVVPYGDNVEKLDAIAAIRRYRPQVVIGAWVTHLYDPARHAAGGNEFGVNEDAVLDACEYYVFLGNTAVHAGKRIWARAHARHAAPGLYSRAANGSQDISVVWVGQQATSPGR